MSGRQITQRYFRVEESGLSIEKIYGWGVGGVPHLGDTGDARCVLEIVNFRMQPVWIVLLDPTS